MLIIKPDEWLSKITGIKCYNLLEAPQEPLWIQFLKNGPLFVYSKVDPHNIDEVHSFENLNFRLIDTALTFTKPITIKKSKRKYKARMSQPEDRNAIKELAAKTFSLSRFHIDPEFPTHIAHQVKACWADNFFLGKRGDQMVVAEEKGQVIGFIQLLIKRDRAIIDLIGVDKSFQKKGIASNMIHFVQDQFSHLDYLDVGTQLVNQPSIQLYQKMGFALQSAKYVFHYHQKA